jgi:hypothetical protein
VIADKRRLRVYQVMSDGGELSLGAGAECWQDDMGAIKGLGLWYDVLVPAPADLEAQARSLGISTLEWLRRRLVAMSYIKVEAM